MYHSFESSNDRRFEELVRDGITAAKNGHNKLARGLLENAVQLKISDARPWLWLAKLAEDTDERRKYLEYAVAAEPGNEAARYELVLLSGKIDLDRLVPQGEKVAPLRPTEPEDAAGQSFQCTQCGGRMYFNPRTSNMTCSYCGHTQLVESVQAADTAEQVMDFVLPTTRAHRWAEARKRVTCQSCGAVALLDPGHLANRCSYCGSNHLLDSLEAIELIEPHVIGLAKLDAKAAHRQIKEWLGKGLFAPDNLMRDARDFDLRLAYYPFWTFDGTLELPWSCEVNTGTNKNPHWVARSGSEFEFYDDELVPGLSILEEDEIVAIEPFLLKEVVEFKPEHLAGWPAISYDRPLAEASLKAREKVAARVRRRLSVSIEPGQEKRSIQSSAGKWSGGTFKNVLLPLWVGTYQFHGKDYHLLVNGQTGKVAGAKPHDDVKVAMVALGALLLLVLLGLVAYWLWINAG
jgi:DNA-directed RNA polymerase subunit RPC12/RpoP